MPKKLYEVDHPYYCSDNNYFSNDCHQEFTSWEAYMEEGDEDHDMNLIFRFDWVSDEDEEGVEYLDLFYIGQRKGIFRTVRIIVTKEEEPVIRKWLQPRYEKILQLWEPFSNAN